MCVCAQSCPTLFDPLDCSLPGSSVHSIFQARILEWIAIPSPGHIPHLGIEPMSFLAPALAGGFFTTASPGKPYLLILSYLLIFGFVVCAFGVLYKKKSLPRLMWRRFYLMFYSWSFAVSDFIFKPLIHFELMFVSCVR